MSMRFQLDTQNFDKKMQRLIKHTIPSLVEKGMGRAMLSLMNDCILEVPTVPLKEGWLRGSGSVFVQNKLVGTSPHGRPGRAVTAHIEPPRPHTWIGAIGFNTPYAARLHEGLGFTFTEPSAGPKYLESKLLQHRNDYIAEVADTIRNGGR